MAKRTKRTEELIAEFGDDELAIDWIYGVHTAFRFALDIQLTQRIRDKMPTMVWTQGQDYAFTEGDMLHRRDGTETVQVINAKPAAADKEAEDGRYHGYVLAKIYKIHSDGTSKELREIITHQTDFVEFLRTGIPYEDRIL